MAQPGNQPTIPVYPVAPSVIRLDSRPDAVLRRFSPNDGPRLYRAILANPSMIGGPAHAANFNREAAEQAVAHFVDTNSQGLAARTILLVGDSNEIKGLPSLFDRRGDVAELGFSIAEDVRRQGLATAASQALLKWGFGPGKLNTAVMRILPTNDPSKEVAMRLGATQVGMIDTPGRTADEPTITAELWRITKP